MTRLHVAAVALVAAAALSLVGSGPDSRVATASVRGIVALINASSPVDHIYSGQFCGGVVVASRLVLTAAHCVVTKGAGSIDVVVGADNLCGDRPIDGVRLRVSAIEIHPDYHVESARFDLAVLTLEADAPAESIRRVGSAPADGGPAIAVGWGRGPVAGVPPCRLRSTDLTVLSQDECAGRAGSDDREFDPRSMTCAVPARSPAEDTCGGDSGGPLILGDDANEGVVIGVVSWGHGCGGEAPGAYARAESWSFGAGAGRPYGGR